MPIERWLGIDFSGDLAMWGPGCSRSNVWIADVRLREGGLFLHDLLRVQQLPGPHGPTRPFARLASLLSSGTYVAAAIDAPFSLPERFVARVGGHAALLGLVGSAPLPAGQDFMRGADLVRLVAGVAPPLVPPKPLRDTDRWWLKLGVPTRSTLWVAPRGGAPMTAACLTLLHRAGRPLWPWATASSGLIAEAFPAAQLKTWGLPHTKYNGASATAVANRRTIVQRLAGEINLGRHASTAATCADALDAILCALAALAVSRLGSAGSPACLEGCIVVHP